MNREMKNVSTQEFFLLCLTWNAEISFIFLFDVRKSRVFYRKGNKIEYF